MAVLWGAYSGGYRLGLEFVRTAQTTTAETWAVYAWVECYSQTYDHSDTYTVSGGVSGSGTFSIGGGSTTYRVWGKSTTIARTYGQNKTVSVSFSASGVGSGYPPAVTKTFTVAARPYSAPAAPTGVSATRVSDTQVTVSSTATSTTAAPVTAIVIQRSTDGGTYTQVASLSGSGTKTWADTGVAAGHYYRYRAYAQGSGGASPVTYAGYVYMTPNPPRSADAAKDDNQNIVLSWVNGAIGQYQTVIADGSSILATVAAGTTTYTVTAPDPAVAHTLVVWHTIGGLDSSKVAAPEIQLLAAPYAPTIVAPSGGYLGLKEPTVFMWRHNPADGTAQSKAEIQYALNTATPQWSAPVVQTGEEESKSLFFSSVTSFLWRVRTWGQAADKPSPWSTSASFTVVYPPAVTWTTPIADATITTATLTVSGAISGGNGSIEVVVTDTSARNTQVFQQTVPATPSFTATVGGLENSHTYVIAVRPFRKVWGGSVSRTVKVAYAAPATPSLTARWDPDTGSTQLSIMAGNAEGTAETVSLSVQRQSETGEWETIATGLPVQTDLTDYAPPLSGVLGYRVVAVSTLDTTEVSDETTVQAVSDGVFINWGAGGSRCVKLAWNITAETQEKALTRNEYVFAGNTLPTLIQGMAVRAETRISALLGALRWAPNVEETMRALTEASMTATPVIVRRPDYRPLSGYLEASAPKDTDGVYTVSFTHYEAL